MASSIFSFLIFLFIISFSFVQSLTSSKCDEADRNALLSIKSAFDVTSWDQAADCCSWYGVGCDATGRVTVLLITGESNFTTSPIPSAIGALSFLRTLTIRRRPNLLGSIPYSFARLNRLTHLDLSRNSLSGQIPPFLSLLTSLTYLNLALNKFSGPIPPTLSALTDLNALHLEGNRLTGTIPDTFGDFRSSLQPDLFLSYNHLSGPIPRSLGLPDWGIIDLSRNQLTGDASFLFGSTKTTIQINLSRNQLSFNLTEVSFPARLRWLDLSRNRIHGGIPAQINDVVGLQRFNVSYNMLCGRIPAGTVTSRFDKYSYVPHQCLCGAPLNPCKYA